MTKNAYVPAFLLFFFPILRFYVLWSGQDENVSRGVCRPYVLAHRGSENKGRKPRLLNPGISGSVPAPAPSYLEEHRTRVRSCVNTDWRTLKIPG